jgi:hypothetical protein
LEAQPAPLTVVVSLIAFLEGIMLPFHEKMVLPDIPITGINIRSRISLNQIEKSDDKKVNMVCFYLGISPLLHGVHQPRIPPRRAKSP